MTTIFHDEDADLGGARRPAVAVVGYGNQGRSWALNLRDSGLDVAGVRAGRRLPRAGRGGRLRRRRPRRAPTRPTSSACSCPTTSSRRCRSRRRHDALTIVASGYTLAFDRLSTRRATSAWWRRACSGPRCAAATRRASASSPRSACTATAPGRALARTLAVAKAIGGLRQGAIELTAEQEAVLDLGGRAGAVAGADPREHEPSSARCSSRASRSRRSSPSWSSPARSSAPTACCARRASPRQIGVPLADQPVRPAVAPRALRPPRHRGHACASWSTTSRRGASPTSGTPSSDDRLRPPGRAAGCQRRARCPGLRSRPAHAARGRRDRLTHRGRGLHLPIRYAWSSTSRVRRGRSTTLVSGQLARAMAISRESFRARLIALLGPDPAGVVQGLGALSLGLLCSLVAGLTLGVDHRDARSDCPACSSWCPPPSACGGRSSGRWAAGWAPRSTPARSGSRLRPDTVLGQNVLAAGVLTLVTAAVPGGAWPRSFAVGFGIEDTISHPRPAGDLVRRPRWSSSLVLVVLTVALAAARLATAGTSTT